MESKEILDSDLNQSIQDYLLGKEVIEWEGQPDPKFTITILEIDGPFYPNKGSSYIIGLVFGAFTIAGVLFYQAENWLGLVLTVIIGIGVVVVPDIVKNTRKKNTRYAFSQNRVFFQLWWWGKKSIYSIDFKDIAQITYNEYKDKSGIIHFFPKGPVDFYTHDFDAGKRRIYPTFEMVPNVIELWHQLEKHRQAQ